MKIQHYVQMDGLDVYENYVVNGQEGPTKHIFGGSKVFARNVSKYCQENGYRLKADGSEKTFFKTINS